MRKIEKKMLNAFLAGRNFSKDNTLVQVVNGTITVFLHGNRILEKDGEGRIKIYNCGWFTSTTKSRLHVLLCPVNMGLCQKKGKWLVIKNLVSTSRDYAPFVEGMTVN